MNTVTFFEGIGQVPKEHVIVIEEGAEPKARSYCNVPFKLQNKLKDTLDKMGKDSIIAKVDQPTDWVSGLVIIEKKTEW